MICCLLGFKANFMVRIHYWKCLVIAVADIYRLRLNKRNCKANENGNLQCWCKGILRLLELDCLGRDFQKQPYSYMELKVLYLGSWMPRSFVSSTKGDFFFFLFFLSPYGSSLKQLHRIYESHEKLWKENTQILLNSPSWDSDVVELKRWDWK